MDMYDDLEAKDPEIEMIVTAMDALRKGGIRSLRFPTTLESKFDEYYFTNTLKHIQVSLLTGLLLFAVFGIVDLQLPPADRMHVWFMRYVVVCPTIAAGLAFTFVSRLRRFIQPVVAFVMLAGSLGIVGMVYFDPTPNQNYYYSGILLLIMGAFTFVSLKFWYAISWSLVTTLAYEVIAVFVNHTSAITLEQNTFTIGGAIIIGAFSNYLMENFLRRDFLNSILLKHENQKLQQASRELRLLSISDALTGLGNRRHFDSMLNHEWMRAMRTETPISLIMFDVDCFKLYNDSYGHQAGDACLRMVADAIGGFARRPGDTAARFGGEEFVLLLPGDDIDQAASVAELCREAVESLKIPHGHSTVSSVVTVSAGVASMVPGSDTSSKVLVASADRSLYQAKREGRNRVVPVGCTSMGMDVHQAHVVSCPT